MTMIIDEASLDDVPGILAIYNEVLLSSTAIYAEVPVDLANRIEWFEARRRHGFPVLVARDGHGIAGYASFGSFRSFPGYRYTVEHSIHIRADARAQGLGRRLMEALIPLARAMGMHAMIAGIDAANEGSIRFHERFGFERVATFPEVGRKFGRWLDLACMQLFLDPPGSGRPD
ncbi:phosphinothricin acetyltransferase [Arboricoccus pini]|uniref:Phosphinothricin acetyltransferase n=1 Tax=Arboricoccus pini TaxID=1963835 RepID=A0A212PZM4_9PROT|nr:GNAT family N-acetyltransferase [Arboricoccus pini]SNB52414.1 phosphinothricin acetyltransferase [Arboricoccus pini]